MFESVLGVKHKLIPKLGEKRVIIVENLGTDDDLSQGWQAKPSPNKENMGAGNDILASWRPAITTC